MPPNASDNSHNGVLFETDADTADLGTSFVPVNEASERKIEVVWKNLLVFGYLYVSGFYGGYLFLFSAKWRTDLFAIFLYFSSLLGITAGVHRLWAHKSYKAKLPLRIILMIFNTIAFQNTALNWARDHRMHHKYSETDADPHNATRGFFFAHVGWLLCRKHPELKRKGKQIDMSDLYADPVLMFQKKYCMILIPLLCFILPSAIPVYCWGESWTNAYFVAAMFRYTLVLNVTWLVNSAAHMFGNKPYDKNINPVQNMTVTLFALGEGYHNYHHTFPWDYKTSEFGNSLNLTTKFINMFAKIGWAYDLKTVSDEIIRKRAQRTGDGSHSLWGWGDKNQHIEEINAASIINKKS